MTPPVTVGLATYRRPQVEETLRSLDALKEVRAARIIVADNDETPSARERIVQLGAELRTPLEYLHAPARNIAIARNAVIEAAGGGLLAFIDDDETAAPDWLEKLTGAWSPGIAAVMGPMKALYPEMAPDWMKILSPHSQIPPVTDGVPQEGHTANCLIDLDHDVMGPLRFDPAFGRKGGSDSVYFSAAARRGARFAYADEAVVFEPVTEGRMSRGWLLRRRWRFGLTIAATSRRSAPVLFGLSLAKVLYCAGLAVLNIPSPAGFHRALLRGTMHLGVAAGALGTPMGEWYGKSDPD